MRDAAWIPFALGWGILFLGAWSFGIRDLLGVEQMRAWVLGMPARQPLPQDRMALSLAPAPDVCGGADGGVGDTPHEPVHALLALGLTGYVLIALRYEERDLARTFGARYNRWRGATQ